MQPRKALQTLVYSAVAVFVVLVLSLLLLRTDTVQNLPLPALFSGSSKVGRLHVLIVATNTNLDLCRLLLSLAVLSYPQPVLIDWDGAGEFNASETHLAKVAGTFRYLDSLPEEKDDDLVLMLDGFDIFMQLGPDVLLKRYFQTTAAAKSRLERQFGAKYVKEHGLHDSIIFGPDKMCWPEDPRRPACWGVPVSTLDSKAFGPDTDLFADPQLVRPRWLNSGTILGPAKEMRHLFQGAVEKIKIAFDDDYDLRTSDQLYFADVWADQEYMRQVDRYGEDKVEVPTAAPTTLPGIALPTNFPGIENEPVFIPDLESTTATDFHIGLDYESRMFQTCAFYENYLDWKTFNESETWFDTERVPKRKMHWPRDVAKSPKPFAAIKDDKKLSSTSWKDIALGVNGAAGHIFPVLHFTGNKVLRDEWWPRMWYFKHAEQLLRAASQTKQYQIGSGPIEKVKWQKDVPYAGHGMDREAGTGAWIDEGDGGHKEWDELCGNYEPIMFSPDMPDRPSDDAPNASASASSTTTATPDPLPYWSRPPGGRTRKIQATNAPG